MKRNTTRVFNMKERALGIELEWERIYSISAKLS